MQAPRNLASVTTAQALTPGHVRALADEFAAASLDAVGRGTGGPAGTTRARARFASAWNLRGAPPKIDASSLDERHVQIMLLEFLQECRRALGRVPATLAERQRARERLAASWNAWRRRG
jgi:hypothetical protein